MKNKSFLYTIIFILFLSPIVFAQSPAYTTFSDIRDGFSKVTGIPTQFLQFPELLYYLIIPTLAIIAITFAFLQEFQIFKRTQQVNVIIAISVGLVALSSTFTYVIASLLLKVMGVFGFMVVFGVFMIGAGFFAYAKFNDFKIRYGVPNDAFIRYRIENLEKKIAKLNAREPKSPEDNEKLAKWRAELESLKARHKEVSAHVRVQQSQEEMDRQKKIEENDRLHDQSRTDPHAGNPF